MSEPVSETELRALGSLRRQCLFAVTILLVEDSRSASEAIRLFAAESGARVRRADSLHAASRHLAIYRPNVVMIDLGLPDGDGLALIRHLATASTPMAAIVALSGHDRDGLAGRRDGGGRGGLPGEADREPAVVPGVHARRAARRRDAAAARRGASWRWRAAPRCAPPRRGPAPRPRPADRGAAGGDGETVAYCAQFLGSVGEMLGDRELRRGARRRRAGRDAGCSPVCSTGGSGRGARSPDPRGGQARRGESRPRCRTTWVQ